MQELQPDLLFVPFTAPFYWQPNVPMVVILHDLQHLVHPEFFSAEQRLNREGHVTDACLRAERVVCVSEHVRQMLVAHVPSVTRRALTIHHAMLHEFDVPTEPSDVLERLGLASTEYLLYPANFWPHKNHGRLFEALRLLPTEARPKLVCTGAPGQSMQTVQALAKQLLGPDAVVFPGYVAPRDFLALLDTCTALIYPSLYEGFGMPVLEAMARAKPVLCSNVTSLPEVAGDAATYFNAMDSADIARAITDLRWHPEAIAARVEIGRERAQRFGDPTDMAQKYIAVVEEVFAAR
jgi:glycosyltransferase involved in cell wall biosynthesis